MKSPGGVVAAVLLSLTSVSAFAALLPKHEEWGKGPAQWIMTRDEQRAWKNVKSDPEAIDFIDLFWARRDPSDGTPENEYRDEFEGRVKFADERWQEPRRRGAMSDRGRVYITLGPATNMSAELQKNTGQAGGLSPSAVGEGSSGASDPTGGRALGARDVWIWERGDARKFGLPKIEAVFVEDPVTRFVKRDTQRNDVMAAMPVAIKSSIIRPTLTEVPNWAPRGGLEPKITVLVMSPVEAVAEMPATVGETPATNAGAPVGSPAAAVPAAPALPVIAPGDRGASRFTFVKDVFAINTETKKDPFTTIVHVDRFTRADELGWVARYCVESTEAPSLKITSKIRGEVNGETINMTAPEEEMTPDRIKATPGCWLIRGAIPVADMDPATYKFTVKIEDPATGKSYNLAQEFKVE